MVYTSFLLWRKSLLLWVMQTSCVISFSTHKDSMQYVLILFSFYRWVNCVKDCLLFPNICPLLIPPALAGNWVAPNKSYNSQLPLQLGVTTWQGCSQRAESRSFTSDFQKVSLEDRSVPLFLSPSCWMERHGMAGAPAAILANKVAATCSEQQNNRREGTWVSDFHG